MKKTTHILFTIYIFLVIWIILFKLSVSIDQLPHFRSINLIPFYYPNKTTYQIREVLDNLIIFIPFGLYLKTLNIINKIKINTTNNTEKKTKHSKNINITISVQISWIKTIKTY